MVKKAKKRGVKPGTKRGKYNTERKQIVARLKHLNEWKVSENQVGPATPQILNLCGQLEEAIVLLETRISSAIAKINSLMGNVNG